MSVKSISEYIESCPEQGQTYLREFIEFMEQNHAQIIPKISFSMPMWLLGTKMKEGYVAISAAKQHVSIHFSSEAFVRDLEKRLPECKAGKQCINIKYGDNQSFDAVKQAVTRFLTDSSVC